MKKPSYSFSRLERFEACPWAYKKTFLDKVPRVENEALITGRTLHDTIADYLKRLIARNLQTDWEWARAQDFLDVPDDVPEVWERFYNSFVLPPMEAPGVELQLAFDRNWKPTKYFGDEAYFRLVVDLTYLQSGLAVVQDWKSNRQVPETVAKNLQLCIYGWGVRQALYPDAQEVLLRLHFLRYGAEREILLAPGDLDTVPQELETKIAQIEAEKAFTPRPGSFCGMCGVTAHCPVMAQALVPVEVMAPATREQAEKAAALLLAMEAMDKALKERLKEWVRVNGPIYVGDMVYGPSLSTSYDFGPQEVVGRLLDGGLDKEQVWPLLGITKTALERGLKKLKRKDLLEQILAAGPTKVTEKIGFTKIK